MTMIRILQSTEILFPPIPSSGINCRFTKASMMQRSTTNQSKRAEMPTSKNHPHHLSSYYQHHTPTHLHSVNKIPLTSIWIGWMICSFVLPTTHGCAIGINQEGQLTCSRSPEAGSPWISACVTAALKKEKCVSIFTFFAASRCRNVERAATISSFAEYSIDAALFRCLQLILRSAT